MEIKSSSSADGNSAGSSPDEQMTIYLKMIKTIGLEVKRSYTIRKIKEMVHEKEGVLEYFQEIYRSGDHLKDDLKLVNCEIHNNSTLHLVLQNTGAFKLYVSISSQKRSIVVEAKSDYTIAKIKWVIHEQHQIHQDAYCLYHSGLLLEDDRSLISLGIKGGSTLHLIFNPTDVLCVRVKMPSGGVDVKVKALYTVRDLKEIVGSIVGFSVSDRNLTYGGAPLLDSKTLASYDIEQYSILEMLPSQIHIFVKSWNGTTLSLLVHQNDTIEFVKEVIRKKIGVVNINFGLLFSGKRLEDNRDLTSYGIEKDSTLHMGFLTSRYE